MNILVINAGSSSLKYQLIDMSTEKVLAKGLCEKIGIDGKITHKTHDGYKDEHEANFPTHSEAFQELVKVLSTGEHAVIKDKSDIGAIGHRVVQGGTKFSASVKITEEVIAGAEEFSALAPLHNPACIAGIRACQNVFSSDIPQVAVLILLSIRPCLKKPISIHSHMNILRNTASVNMGSTAPATGMSAPAWLS